MSFFRYIPCLNCITVKTDISGKKLIFSICSFQGTIALSRSDMLGITSRIATHNVSAFAHLIAFVLMEMVRFELMTPCLQGRCSPN